MSSVRCCPLLLLKDNTWFIYSWCTPAARFVGRNVVLREARCDVWFCFCVYSQSLTCGGAGWMSAGTWHTDALLRWEALSRLSPRLSRLSLVLPASSVWPPSGFMLGILSALWTTVLWTSWEYDPDGPVTAQPGTVSQTPSLCPEYSVFPLL